MKTFENAAETVLVHYRALRELVDEAIANEDPNVGYYAVQRSAVYDVLLALFDYDQDAAAQFIEKKC